MMIFLGLVLIAVSMGLGAGIYQENTGSAHLTVYDTSIPGMTTDGRVFLAGAALGAVLLLGLVLTYAGARRTVRRRQELTDLSEERADSVSILLMENGRLQRELTRLKGGAPEETPAPAESTTGTWAFTEAR
jgi:hypothetical protein